MKRLSIKICLMIIFCCGVFSAIHAETPLRLARILKMLPCKPTDGDTIFTCPSISDRRMIISHGENGDVSHLGIFIFAPEYKSFYNPYVCNCIERLFLEMLLCSSESERIHFLKEQNVRLVLDGFRFGTEQFSHLRKGLNLLNEKSSMSIKEGKDSYVFIVSALSGEEMQMTIPKDRELIFATDKKEQDERIDILLQTSKPYRLSPNLPQANALKAKSGNTIWYLPGTIFMIDSLRTDTYYTLSGTKVEPLFDRLYPCESFCNLLLGQVDKPQYTLDITHKMYGLSIPRFNMALSDFIGQMREGNSEFYASARLIDGGKNVAGVLLIYNAKFKYINMLTLTVSLNDLFESNGSLPSYLYTNVPQHNIMNLFVDNQYKINK